MIKWIVTDMDGTLLNSKQKISSGNRDAIMKCQKLGIKVILASGRSYTRLQMYGDILKLREYGGYYIEVNGMAIKNVVTEERVIFQRLEGEQIQRIFQCLKKYNVEIEAYLDDTIFDYIPDELYEIKKAYRALHQLPDDYPWTGGDLHLVHDVRDGYPNIHYIQDASTLPHSLNKISALHEPDVIDVLYPRMIEELGEEFELARTSGRIVEFTPKGITKGNALQRFMDEHQIRADEVIVFGDGENDLSLFAKAKYAIAMENAPQSIKDAAVDVTCSNDEDGVAAGLYKYILSK